MHGPFELLVRGSLMFALGSKGNPSRPLFQALGWGDGVTVHRPLVHRMECVAGLGLGKGELFLQLRSLASLANEAVAPYGGNLIAALNLRRGQIA